jgi:nitrogenase molybdenum-iron protein alpha/beta subunit
MIDHDKIRKVVRAMKEKTGIPGIKVQSIPKVSVRSTK